MSRTSSRCLRICFPVGGCIAYLIHVRPYEIPFSLPMTGLTLPTYIHHHQAYLSSHSDFRGCLCLCYIFCTALSGYLCKLLTSMTSPSFPVAVWSQRCLLPHLWPFLPRVTCWFSDTELLLRLRELIDY